MLDSPTAEVTLEIYKPDDKRALRAMFNDGFAIKLARQCEIIGYAAGWHDKWCANAEAYLHAATLLLTNHARALGQANPHQSSAEEFERLVKESIRDCGLHGGSELTPAWTASLGNVATLERLETRASGLATVNSSRSPVRADLRRRSSARLYIRPTSSTRACRKRCSASHFATRATRIGKGSFPTGVALRIRRSANRSKDFCGSAS